MNIDKIICPICGCTEIVDKNGMYYCRACGTSFKSVSSDVDEATRRYIDIQQAERHLKLSPPDFERAQTMFESIAEDYPTWSAPYWGIVRAKYGIKYEMDIDEKVIPTCYKSKYQDFSNDKDFLSAVKHAENTELKNKYLSEAKRISSTWKEWETKASKFDYDVFISFKATDNDYRQETEDAALMGKLYQFLIGNGYRVFFSPVSMASLVGSDNYDAYIFNAIEKAKVMIVYGSKPEYFSSTWVKNEWSRYLLSIKDGEKVKDSLLLCYKGLNPSISLPTKLAKIQGLNMDEPTAFHTILEKVKLLTKQSISEDNIKKEEEAKKTVKPQNTQQKSTNFNKNENKSFSEKISDWGTKVGKDAANVAVGVNNFVNTFKEEKEKFQAAQSAYKEKPKYTVNQNYQSSYPHKQTSVKKDSKFFGGIAESFWGKIVYIFDVLCLISCFYPLFIAVVTNLNDCMEDLVRFILVICFGVSYILIDGFHYNLLRKRKLKAGMHLTILILEIGCSVGLFACGVNSEFGVAIVSATWTIVRSPIKYYIYRGKLNLH